ncbi:hypothetical protein Nepgr_012470 [Nepenthes gracilis]|uniref:Uncharacterized protein n=1 Tax=Nepenthes gracilis TaxID=150966 RepID=A0AAD3SHA2_NEPGR|nr:hypothetical protein Nepgr_012470 [Nepenthes gracilis]
MSFQNDALALRRAWFKLHRLRLRSRFPAPEVHHKSQNKIPPKNKPNGRQIPLALVGGARRGNGPWRVKSKSQPAIVSAGPVPESNSFAALQCPENDTPSGPTDGVEKNDAIDFTEPDLGPTLNGVETDLRILTPSDLERENRGESPLENDDSGHDCSSSVMRGLICDTPLPEGDQMGGGASKFLQLMQSFYFKELS